MTPREMVGVLMIFAGAVAFGIWQQSAFAGMWMLVVFALTLVHVEKKEP